MVRLAELTQPRLIFTDLAGHDGAAVLRTMAERVAREGAVPDADALYRKLCEREKLGSTGIGHGVAIPHCKLSGIDRVVVALGVASQGVDFLAVDGEPVRLFFLVVSPDHAPAAHLQCLASISKWVKVDHHVDRILRESDPSAIYAALTDQEEAR